MASESLKDDPSASDLNEFSWALVQEGEELQLALSASERAIKQQSNNLHYLHTFATALLASKKWEECRPVLIRIFSQEDPEAPTLPREYLLQLLCDGLLIGGQDCFSLLKDSKWDTCRQALATLHNLDRTSDGGCNPQVAQLAEQIRVAGIVARIVGAP